MIHVSTIPQYNAPPLNGRIRINGNHSGESLRRNHTPAQQMASISQDLVMDLGELELWTEEAHRQAIDEMVYRTQGPRYHNPFYHLEKALDQIDPANLTAEQRKTLVATARGALASRFQSNGFARFGDRSLTDITRLLEDRLEVLKNDTSLSEERRDLEISLLKEAFVKHTSAAYFDLSMQAFRSNLKGSPRDFMSNFRTAKNFALNTMTTISNTTNNETLRQLVAEAMNNTLTKAAAQSPIIALSKNTHGHNAGAKWQQLMSQERAFKASGELEMMLEAARQQLNLIANR